MSDINLLPEDLKKKQDKTLQNRGGFSLEEIEFTEGEKLKKHTEAKLNTKNKINKWFKPKVDSKLTQKKEYNKIEKDKSTDFVPRVDSKPKEIKKDVSKNIDNLKEMNLNVSKIVPEINKNGNNKLEKKNLSDFSNKSEIKDKNFKKPKKIKFSFKDLIKKFSRKKKKKEKKKNLDVNLLPFGSNIPTTKKMFSVLIIAFIVSSLLVFVIYFAYHIYKGKIIKEHNGLENQLNLYMEDSKKFDDLIYEINIWQGKIEEIETLLNEHIYWTKFFEKLEENTLPNVKFTSFAGTVGSVITLQATAPDYQTVSKQWIHLQKAEDFVKEVSISGATMSVSEDAVDISFSLTLDFVDDIFYK